MLEALGIKFGSILAMVISFLLLVGLLHKYAFGPLIKAIDERRAKIQSDFDKAERELVEASKLREEYVTEQTRVRKEAHDIMANATKIAEEKAQEIVTAARQEADNLRDRARAEIEREKEKAIDELRTYTVNISILAAQKAIEKNIDPSTQKKLVDEAIKEVGRLPC
ncbi:F0F1 ATP synthase subunit B [Heliorestis acidaminivorans]|nr:F0F1 ATP synthase subunit B [Heliorestis acidaminivorans]